MTVPPSRATESATPPGIVSAVRMVGRRPDHGDRVRAGEQPDRRRRCPRRTVDEVGRRDDPHRPARSRRAICIASAPAPRSSSTASSTVAARIGRSPRARSRMVRPSPGRGQRAGQDAELVGPAPGLGQRRLAALGAGAELAQGAPRSCADLGAQPLLARVEVGQDPHQVVLAGVGQLRCRRCCSCTWTTSANASSPTSSPIIAPAVAAAARRHPRSAVLASSVVAIDAVTP